MPMRGQNMLEDRISSFARERGIGAVGLAGPERLAGGPPSMDPTYTMKGARSIVSLAVPMDVDAIYEFLSKRSPVPHNLDQLRGNQSMHRHCKEIADYIVSLGYKAAAVPPNNNYRRSLDVFATYPDFSHRFGAIASGIGGQAWSGNVMTREYGAAVYLGTVVTEAELESDPMLPPRYFVDEYCKKCKLCERACPSGMFDHDEEEQVLLCGELHPRAKRHNIDFCNASCFGLHALSRDKKWSSWGRHWMKEWMDQRPDGTRKRKIRAQMLRKGGSTGDSTLRYDLIRRLGSMLWPKELLDELPQAREMPEDELERNALLERYAQEIGVRGLKDYNVLTCGQCALVCGPNLKETADRLHMLIESGIVVPGPDGKMVRAETFEQAARIMKSNPSKVTKEEKKKDALASAKLWHKYYFGIEPRSIIKGVAYKRRLKKAAAKAGALAGV